MLGLADVSRAPLINCAVSVLIAPAVVMVRGLSATVSLVGVGAMAISVGPAIVMVAIITASIVAMPIPVGVTTVIARAALGGWRGLMVFAMIAARWLPQHRPPVSLNRLVPNIRHNPAAFKMNHSLADRLVRPRRRVVAPCGKDPLAHIHGWRAQA